MPRRGRRYLPLAVAAATAVVLIPPLRVLVPDCGSRRGPLAAEAVVLRVLTASQKAPLMEDIFTRFLASGPHVDGRCIRLDVRHKPSGEAADALIGGWSSDDGASSPRSERRELRAIPPTEPWWPDVWYPSASVWVEQVRDRRRDMIPQRPPSVAETPHVVAMPRPMAEALGWPRADIGWKDLLDLAADPRGWESRGHPEWGRFRLGKTNPNSSTSGLYATIGAYFAAKQAKQQRLAEQGLIGPADRSTTDLTHEDTEDGDVLGFVRALESSVVYYGDTSLKMLPHLRAADDVGRALGFVSAIALQETSVLEYNLGNKTGEVGGERGTPPREPLVAVYPREGVLVADQPYVVLNAGWVTKPRRDAARVLLEFLGSKDVEQQFLNAGFRLPKGRFGSIVSADPGLLPGGPATRLTPPASDVVDAVRSSWAMVRKRARVLFVIDTSAVTGSPADGSGATALQLLQQAAVNALDHFGDDDEVGVWGYSPNVEANPPYVERARVDRLAGRRAAVKAAISSLRPAGPNRLAATLGVALDRLKGSFDPAKITGIVVLTHGAGPPVAGDAIGLNSVVTAIGDEARAGRLRVFPVAYGSGAGCETPERIAKASQTEAACAVDPSVFLNAVNDAVANL